MMNKLETYNHDSVINLKLIINEKNPNPGQRILTMNWMLNTYNHDNF